MKAVNHSLLALAIGALFAVGAAQAQISDGVVKIGVLSDMSSLYADLDGNGPTFSILSGTPQWNNSLFTGATPCIVATGSVRAIEAEVARLQLAKRESAVHTSEVF